jgi:hypothetical protein
VEEPVIPSGRVSFGITAQDYRYSMHRTSDRCLVACALNRCLDLPTRDLYASVGLRLIGIHVAAIHKQVAVADVPDEVLEVIEAYDDWVWEPHHTNGKTFTLDFRRVS